MIVTIKNQATNSMATFMDSLTYARTYGQETTLPLFGYGSNVIRTKTFIMNNPAGFWGNSVITSSAVKGINEDGLTFQGNSHDGFIYSWEFTPSFDLDPINYITPVEYLNSVIFNKNGLLTITVSTNVGTYTNDVYTLDASNTERGVLAFHTALPGEGSFWSRGMVKFTWHLFESGSPYVPKNFAERPLIFDIPDYPYEFSLDSLAEVSPIWTIHNGTLPGEKFDTITITNTTTGEFMTYDNSLDQDTIITINTIELTVSNQNGIDKSGNFSGDFVRIINGTNNYTVEINDFTSHSDAEASLLPRDFHIDVDREILTWGVQ